MKPLSERILSACTNRGLSRAEYLLLSTAGLRINLPRESFASYTYALSEGDPEPVPSVQELNHAVWGLCDRGLLAVLSCEDIEREERRLLASTLPELHEADYRAGHLDFTPAGYCLYRELMIEVFGADRLAHSDSGFMFDETSQLFVVLAPSRELCLRRILEIRKCPDAYAGSAAPLVVSVVCEPEPIGAWKPNRFQQYERGFRCTVRVSKVE